MSQDLIVGRIDEVLVDDVDDILQQIGAGRAADWLRSPEEIAIISVLNVASVNLFNTFAAGLEGITGHDAMDRSRFKTLPWWLNSVWLPVDIEPTGRDPVFVGSVLRLEADLLEIQRLAGPLSLGTVPDEYNRMREDYRAWWRAANASNDTLSEDDTLRWIWRAFYDGAQIAKREKAPMFCLGG